jgi:hypothetical protein
MMSSVNGSRGQFKVVMAVNRQRPAEVQRLASKASHCLKNYQAMP